MEMLEEHRCFEGWQQRWRHEWLPYSLPCFRLRLPADTPGWVFCQHNETDCVSDVTGMKALTSILLMNVIQIVIWMFAVMMSLQHAGLIDATAIPPGPGGNNVAISRRKVS